MDEKEFNISKKIIRETFNDPRKIKCITCEEDRKIDENIYSGGEIFTTETGEFIDLEFQIEDFTVDELVKYVEFAEAMYEKHHKAISIYIICPENIQVNVKECPIKSDADFNIKLASTQASPAHIFLDIIKNKIRNEHPIEKLELEILENLPMLCKKEERNYFRREYLKIINKINY